MVVYMAQPRLFLMFRATALSPFLFYCCGRPLTGHTRSCLSVPTTQQARCFASARRLPCSALPRRSAAATNRSKPCKRLRAAGLPPERLLVKLNS